MEWKLTKNELPEENVYVLVHIKNEFNNCDVKNYYAVARIEKGISEEERDKMPECPRKRRYYPGDVFGNNLVPYNWSTIGPAAFFGQEVDKWAYIDDMGSLNNVTASEVLETFNRIKTAPDFMGGTFEYRANPKSEIPYMQDCTLVESALLKAQEQEKVLRIIKEKRVDLPYLRCCFEDNQSVERYNEYIRNKTIDYDHEEELTEEEFELLKRYFND